MSGKLMNIVIIGFTSSGKSATGRALAAELDIPFVDLDHRVEDSYFHEHGERLSCRDLYIRIGDTVFGAYERKVMLETTMHSKLVLSTGGKAPLRNGNAEILKAWGTIVYLKTSPEVVFQRMEEKGPPAYLADDFSVETVVDHWKSRSPMYEEMAELTISNDELSINATARSIIEKLGLKE